MNELITVFDRQFRNLHERSCLVISDLSDEDIFRKFDSPAESSSCGEYILRSAGKVEQTFGGITSRLWDDPFEWTLPEELSTAQKINEYLEEVETTRKKGFEFFTSDEVLTKELPAPEKMKSVFELLLETVVKAETFQRLAVFVKSGIQN